MFHTLAIDNINKAMKSSESYELLCEALGKLNCIFWIKCLHFQYFCCIEIFETTIVALHFNFFFHLNLLLKRQ